MCIIIYIPKGASPPTQEILEHCWKQNPHGGGFMYTTPNKNMKIYKSLTEQEFYDTFWRRFKQFGSTSPFVLHMRYATDGEKTLANTHPFKMNRDWAFVHNGRLRQYIPNKTEKEVSDTSLFNTQLMKKLPSYWFDVPIVKRMLDYHIVKQNRLVFMSCCGEIWIIGEKEGEWLNGIWYSNDYYKTHRKTISCDTKYVYANWLDTSWEDGATTSLYVTKQSKFNVDPPLEWYKKRSPNLPGCGVCGTTVKWSESRNILVRFQPWKVIQRVDCCEECYELFKKTYKISDIDTEVNCILCNKPIKKVGSCRMDYVGVEYFNANQLDIIYADSACVHTYLRHNTDIFLFGYAAWMFNVSSEAIHFKATFELVQHLGPIETD